MAALVYPGDLIFAMTSYYGLSLVTIVESQTTHDEANFITEYSICMRRLTLPASRYKPIFPIDFTFSTRSGELRISYHTHLTSLGPISPHPAVRFARQNLAKVGLDDLSIMTLLGKAGLATNVKHRRGRDRSQSKPPKQHLNRCK